MSNAILSSIRSSCILPKLRLCAGAATLLISANLTVAVQAAQAAPALRPIAGQEAAPRQLMRAYFKDIKIARAIAHSKFETLESKYELGYVVVSVNPAEARELRALGFRLLQRPYA